VHFIVPENLIRAHSGVIDTAISAIAEGGEKRIPLPNVNPEHFTWYVGWHYSGRLFILLPGRVPAGEHGHEVTEIQELTRWTF